MDRLVINFRESSQNVEVREAETEKIIRKYGVNSIIEEEYAFNKNIFVQFIVS